jgi:hypothetical protein
MKLVKVSDIGTRFLPFDNIVDLLRKVDDIKKAHKINSESFRQILRDKDIKFEPIDDYGVFIDVELLSEEDVWFIKNHNDSFIQEVYYNNGVVSSVVEQRELLIAFLEMNNWLSLEDEENAKGVVDCYLKIINCA